MTNSTKTTSYLNHLVAFTVEGSNTIKIETVDGVALNIIDGEMTYFRKPVVTWNFIHPSVAKVFGIFQGQSYTGCSLPVELYRNVRDGEEEYSDGWL
jgi:hypothetical protein